MSDERHGPFFVSWYEPVPPRNADFGPPRSPERCARDLAEAVRFVMEEVPAASRATAWIVASVGPSVEFAEIVTRYAASNE
jgi:hypothetical protein